MPLPVGVEGSMFLACPSICDYCWRDISTTSGWIFVGLIWNFHYNQQIQIKVRARSVVWNIFFIFSSYLLVCHTEMLLAHSCSKTQGPFFFFWLSKSFDICPSMHLFVFCHHDSHYQYHSFIENKEQERENLLFFFPWASGNSGEASFLLNMCLGEYSDIP